jgi:radical SAM protein with 4Fe4S-binding SPASM domain
VKGSFDAALTALRLISACGLSASVTTQVTSLIIPQLRQLMNLFIEAGVTNWQVQLTVAMGRAADHPELLLQPYDLSVLMPLLANLFEEGVEHGLLLQPGNNIGYFGPYEALWRGNGDERIYWASCNAGQNTMGIEADGTIKGCPSLPTTQYAGGNIRNHSLEQIWRQTPELSFTRSSRKDSLWGFCRTCYYAEACQAGCTWTSHSLLGRPGNNPYCHHRVLELARQGMRERIEPAEPAPGRPFDHGRFKLVLETLDGHPPVPEKLTAYESNVAPPAPKPLVQITTARGALLSNDLAASACIPRLVLCRGCNRHVEAGTAVCPYCGGDTKALAVAYRKKLRAARQAFRRLLRALGDASAISRSPL